MDYLPESYFYCFGFFIIGIVVGSFLNVVIFRLPIMLTKAWRNQANEYLELPLEEYQKTFNLALPGSHCPQCQHKIPFYFNIPVLSYLFLRGKCHYCHGHISAQYPIVEFLTAVIFALMFLKFDIGWALIGGLILASGLIVLTVIDLNQKLLPDIITIPWLWLGLLFNVFAVYDVALASAVLGAVAGYMIFWAIYQLFKLVTSKEAMGYGDFKLMACMGAWLGINQIPILILSSAVLGLLLALVLKVKKNQNMPFGPAIATAGLMLFMFQHEITTMFLSIYE